jgi:diguanylate cyclase (GGDEF)-like protein
MKTTQVISVIQILIGAAIMLYSIIVGLQRKFHVSKKFYKNWFIALSLIIFLFSGYIIYSVILMLKIQFPLELITGSLLLGGSLYVLVIVKFTKAAASDLQNEITGRRQVEKKLRELSLIDQLTGLYNRKGFYTLVQNHMEIAKRDNKKAILVYAEVNNIKRINNKFGRQEGDMMILGTANNMKATFRKSDIIARIGSDEFVVFLSGAAEENIKRVIDRFRQSITIHNSKKRGKYDLSIDIVLLTYDLETGFSVDDMLARARDLMYEGKKSVEEISVSENYDNTEPEEEGNFILFVNNMSDSIDSFDLKINIDGKAVVNEDSFIGSQNAWKPYEFNLTKNRHKIRVESREGKARLEEEFEIRTKHMAVIEYSASPSSGTGSNLAKSNRFTFNIQDV